MSPQLAIPFPFAGGALLQKQATTGKKLPEMAALLCEHFSPNVLRVLGSHDDFRADLRTANFGAIQVSTLSYNTAIELAVETAGDHLLVTTQLRGDESVRSQGRSGSGSIGFVVVDSTPEPVTKRFSADSQRLNLRLDRSALESLWHRTVDAKTGASPRVFEPFIAGEADRRRWWSHLQLMLRYLEAPADGPGAPSMRKRIEEALMLYLLLEHPHDRSSALVAAPPAVGADRLDRAEDYVRAHLCDPLCLADIAQAAGISIRSLTAIFRARHDASPMKYVEGLRLDAAQAALRRGGRSVTDVATEYGFSHAGRFAAAYARRFGEPPSRTGRFRTHHAGR